jgi:hypothetical protein
MEITKAGVTVTTASPIVTLDTTRELFAGLNVYSSGAFPVCTKISSVNIDGVTLTLTESGLSTGVYTLLFTDLAPYMYMDLCRARKDVQQIVNEIGQFVEVDLRKETNVTRGNYTGIIERAQTPIYRLKAYPVEYSPSAQQIEKAGLREVVDVTVYTAYQDWIDNSIGFNDIDPIRATVKLNGETYKIKARGRYSPFGNSFLYITLGLTKA